MELDSSYEALIIIILGIYFNWLYSVRL